MTPTLERILEEVRSLSPEERLQLRDALTDDRTARVQAVLGKYAHLPGSSEDFMQRKHAELELEDQRFPPRS